MNFVNLTPHAIKLNDGTEFPPSGTIARVSCTYSEFDRNGISEACFADVEGLPEPKEDTIYIVSSLVQIALNGTRKDVVSPATGHKNCVRNEKGQIISVPFFVRQ